MARHACGVERRVVGFTHGCSLARSAARYPPYQTCHRRFQQWQRSGLLTRLLQTLAEDLRDRGKLDLSEAFIDASFSSAKKGALVSALQNAAKAAKSWQSQTAMVFLSPCTWSALRRMKPRSSNPRSSAASSAKHRERLIGDKAYDSDPLDQRVREHFRVQLIAPHSLRTAQTVTQDGRVPAPLPSSLENRAPVCLAP